MMGGLRARVIVTLVAIIFPVTAVFSAVRVSVERRADIERNVDRFVRRLPPRLSHRCEKSPGRFQIDRGRFLVFAYGETFASLNPEAPQFPSTLRPTDDLPVSETRWFDDYLGATAIRLGGERCAYLLVLWKEPPHFLPLKWSTILVQSLIVFVVLFFVGLIIAEPIVRRIIRLTRAVEGAADLGFDPEPFQGKDELAQLAAAFGRSFDEVAQRDASLKKYVANTTHDLAIPLTVLQHRLRRLQDLALDDDAKDLVGTALEESHYIASLVANMSAAARLDADPKFAEFDLAEIVERVVTRHQPIAAQKGIELGHAVPESYPVELDATLVEQAISNLVQNAIQYNTAGGHVAIVLDVDEQGFQFSVADDGPGVADDLLSLLTERSVRSDDARNRNPGGQGFGLSIAQRVVELHGWRLTLQHNEPGLKVVIRG